MGRLRTALQMPLAAKTRWSVFKQKQAESNAQVVPGIESLPAVSSRAAAALDWFRKPNQLRRSFQPAQPKRTVVIGVHGYFPAKLTRKVLGEPTGTSRKFANEGAEALRALYPQCEVTEIALEGEGLISNRSTNLYTQLKAHLPLLQNADLILFAAHSQGSVVSTCLASRLINENLLNMKKQRLCLLCMAGTFLGPMAAMNRTLALRAISQIEHQSLLELFELQDDYSKVSIALREALQTVLRAGAKLVLVASSDDQLVPLYSALATNLSHSNVFRAVFLKKDNPVLKPLVELACRKLNSGSTDHGVLREMSGVLAGSLVSGGHSSLYAHEGVYRLAVEVAVQTSMQSPMPNPRFASYDSSTDLHVNPFVLPVAVHALISDASNDEQLKPLAALLRRRLRAWHPEQKQLKELKYRLGGITRSKL